MRPRFEIRSRYFFKCLFLANFCKKWLNQPKSYISRTGGHRNLIRSSFYPEYALSYWCFIHYICLKPTEMAKMAFLLKKLV